MRKIIAVFLSCILFLMINEQCINASSNESSKFQHTQEVLPDFTGLDDLELLRYMEDDIYYKLVKELDSEEYFVENVDAVYISKEYLEEMAYNSQANIYFGYTLEELENQFQGTKFIFTLSDDGQTTVQEIEEYNDTYEQVLKDVTIGSGVILLCVTVSVVTAGAGAPAVSLVFAASAKTAAIAAASSSVFAGVSAGVATSIETKDFDQAIKAGALAGSEGFKWGAITGALTGGASEFTALKGATASGLKMNEVAKIQKESKYPLDVIKQFKSMEQYEICKTAGLTPKMVDGKTALIRNIDLDQVDEMGRTNLERMKQGLAAQDPSGQAYELHHIGQKTDSTLAILTKEEHMQKGNNKIWHKLDKESEVHIPENNWDTQRKEMWKNIASLLEKGGF